MAGGVTIDIPGIGNIEAKNAATEKTLQEILKAIKAQGGKPGVAGAAGGTASGGTAAGAAGTAGTSRATAAATRSIAGTASAASKLGGAFGKLAGGPVAMIAGALVSLGEGVTKTISTFANVGDSVESAADVFSGIPVVGSMFKAVASASQKVNDSYLRAASGGATFTGSVNNFAKAASEAGMTMDKFADVIKNNGVGMLGFGDTVESGAKRFASVAKNLQSTASGLQALGYSTEDINGGLARYGELLRLQGQQRGKSDAELTAGAKKYLTEIDQLAKITGEERSAKEAQMKQLATDAQFRMFLAGKDEKVGEDFRNMVGSFGPKLGGFVKDYMATGTLTSEANQKLAAMLGGDVMSEMTRLRQKLLNNQRLTDDEQDRLKSIMAKAAKANAANAGTALAASRDMDDASGGLIEAMSLTDDAHKKSREEQKKAQSETDGMNQRMQEAQKSLAKISNEFQMFLANSGILETMLGAFKALAGFVKTFVMPIFSAFGFVIKNVEKLFYLVSIPLGIFTSVVKNAWTELSIMFESTSSVFQPVIDVFKKGWEIFSALTGVIDDLIKGSIRGLIDGFLWVSDTVEDLLGPAFDMIGRIAGSVGDFLRDNFLEAVKSVADFFTKEFITPIKKMLNDLWSYLQPVVDPIVKAFKDIKNSIDTFFRSFNTLGEVFDSVKLSLRSFALNLKEMWYAIKDFIPGLKDATPEERAALAAEQAALAQDKEKLQNKLDENAKANLAEQQKRDEEKAKAREERDKKIAAARAQNDKKEHEHKVGLDKKAAEDKAAKESGIDYGAGPEELLKQFATVENSPLVTSEAKKEAKSVEVKEKQSTQPTAAAETTKKEIEAEAEKKKAEAAKKAQDYKNEEEAAKREFEKENKKPATQESAETLLAQLNTNMAELIKVTKEQKDIGERQLTVQKSLTGDLFAAV